jgi:heat shock protein HtpX
MTNILKTTFLLALLTALIVLVGAHYGGPGGAAIALAAAAILNFTSYWFSDRMVLAATRAKAISREQAPRLYAIVERLSGRSGLPMPRLYMLPEAAPNAFATGRNPEHAAVAVTQGILELLDDEEMEGVLAHELGHVKNRDILISSVAATLAGAVMWMAHMVRWGAIFGGYGGRDNEKGGGAVGLLATALLAPVAALLIQMAISRSREYQADATGSLLVGQPYGLARALEKLDQYSRQIPMQRTGGAATSHLFIVRPFSGAAFANLFSTHPPIQERIRRLLGR